MAVNRTRDRVADAVSELPVIDIHTHLVGGQLSARGLHDVLLYHMVVSELHAAGCPQGARLTEYPGSPSAEEAADRIQAALPYIPFIENTSTWWCVRIIMRELFGWQEPITAANWKRLDALIRERGEDGTWARSVLDRAGIARSGTELARRGSGEDDDRLEYALEWAFFTRCQWGEFDTALYELERTWGQEPGSPTAIGGVSRPATERRIERLDQVHEAIAHYVEVLARAPIVATATHLSTDIHYGTVTDREMQQAIEQRWEAGPRQRDIYASYIHEHVLRKFEERIGDRLVYQFSLGAEPLPYETASRLESRMIGELGEMLARHPGMRFMCFLGHRSANHGLCTLARELPNLSLAGCWWHNVYPEVARQVLSERLDMLPWSRQVGFFSDAYCVEWSYAKLKMMRWVLSGVLAERIERGQWNEAEAIRHARRILFESPQLLVGMTPRPGQAPAA
jgi:hypothetical protein